MPMPPSRPPEGGKPATALITGASLGIGLELAREFAAHGHPLILVARSGDRLRQLACELPVECQVIEQDLALAGAARSLFEQVDRPVDILVNNAGFGGHGPFLSQDLTTQTQMMQLNMSTLTELCHLFGQPMQARGSGRILNVASTAAFQPGPWMAVYYATKAYVLSLSEALHEEMRGQGVTVTALCPGPTRSGFQARANLEGSLLLRLAMMEAAPVAKAGYQATMAGRPLVITGILNQLLAFSTRFTPRTLLTRLSGKLARKDS